MGDHLKENFLRNLESSLIDMMIDQEIMNTGRKRVLENMKDLVKVHTIVMSGTPAGKEKRKGGKKKHGKGLEKGKVKYQEITMKETGQEVQLEGHGQGHTLDQGLGHIQGHLLDREHLDVQNLARPDVQDHHVAHYLGHQEDLQGGKDQLHPVGHLQGHQSLFTQGHHHHLHRDQGQNPLRNHLLFNMYKYQQLSISHEKFQFPCLQWYSIDLLLPCQNLP